jgi:hypothetical protein
MYVYISWQLVLSSDKISKVKKPIFLVKLNLVDESGTEKEVSLEMSEAELRSHFRSLTRCQQALKMLKA